MESDYCAVRTGSLNGIHINPSIWSVKKVFIIFHTRIWAAYMAKFYQGIYFSEREFI